MAGIREVYRKLEAAKESLLVIAENAVDQTKELFLEENREQLLDGKNRYGQNLSPTYFDDPYFKSRESAARYSAWKDKITPNANRQSGVPNLYINGRYHNSISAKVVDGKLVVQSSFKAANKIENTYPGLYGLSTPFQIDYVKKLRPVFNELFLQKLR